MATYSVTIHGWVRSGNRGAVAHQLENVAFLRIVRGEHERAARLLGAAAALRTVARSPMIDAERMEHDRWMATLRDSADPSLVDEAMAAGGEMTMSAAVELAIADASPAPLWPGLGDARSASASSERVLDCPDGERPQVEARPEVASAVVGLGRPEPEAALVCYC